MEGTTTQWFTTRETYEREIEHPDTKETATVTLRPLNAGDRAELNEIRLLSNEEGDGGEGSIRAGRQQIRTLQLALAAWTLPHPISEATIQQLDPRVFDQILGHVSFGNPRDDKEQAGEGATVTPLPEPQPAAAAESS